MEATHSPASPTDAAFVVIPLLLVGLLLWGTAVAYRGDSARGTVLLIGAFAAAWMTATWLGASTGVFRLWDATPPPFAFLVIAIAALACLLAFSPLGTRLITAVPLWVLILVQSFRLPLELAMHARYEQGIMPVQMSYSGRNFDIVTGLTALAVAAIVRHRKGRGVALAWNVMGLVLVLNVVTVGILSTPRFAYFGSDRLNVWITYPPYVWLPAVMVLAAIAGHLLIFRSLRLER